MTKKDWRAELDAMNEIMRNNKTGSDTRIIVNTITAKAKATNPEFRKNMSLAKTGVKRPDLTGDNNPNRSPAGRLRMSERMKGVPKSKEQIEKFKEAYKQLPMIVCPHCGFEGRNKGNMNRYHFDNCPNNPKKKK